MSEKNKIDIEVSKGEQTKKQQEEAAVIIDFQKALDAIKHPDPYGTLIDRVQNFSGTQADMVTLGKEIDNGVAKLTNDIATETDAAKKAILQNTLIYLSSARRELPGMFVKNLIVTISLNKLSPAPDQIKQLIVDIDFAISQINTRKLSKSATPQEKSELDKQLVTLTNAKHTLEGQYINNLIAAINNNKLTPTPNEIKQLVHDIDYALIQIALRLSNPTLTASERNTLEGQEKTLQSAKDKLEARGDNEELNDALLKYATTYNMLRTQIPGSNLAALNAIKTTVEETITNMELTYGLTKSATGGYVTSMSLDPDVRVVLDAEANRFDSLNQELADRIVLETQLNAYKDIQDQITKLEGTGGKKREIKDLRNQAEVMGYDIDVLVRKLNEYKGIDPTTIKTRPVTLLTVQERKDIADNGYTDVSVVMDRKIVDVATLDALDAMYEKLIDKNRRNEIITFIASPFAPVSGQSWNTIFADMTQPEREYVKAYWKLTQNHIKGIKNEKETDFLRELTNLDSKFGDKSLGTIADFRVLAKEIKGAAKKENKKAKYLEDAFPHLVAYAYAREFNVKGLDAYDAIMQNRSGLSHAHNLPDIFNRGDVWNEGPYYLAAVAHELFGPNRQTLVSGKLPNYFVAGKGRYSVFMPPVHMMPILLPETAVSAGPDRQSGVIIDQVNGEYEIKPDSLDNQALLDWFISTYNRVDLSDGTASIDHRIAHPGFAREMMRRWFSSGSYGMDVEGMLAAKGYKPDEIKKVIDDALKLSLDDGAIYEVRRNYLDEASQYFAAKEKATGQRDFERNIDAIPQEEKYALLSRAFVNGLPVAWKIAGTDRQFIRNRLTNLYGEGWENIQYVQNSSPVIGKNVARIIDGIKGTEYALSSNKKESYSPMRGDHFIGAARWVEDATAKGLVDAGLDPAMARKGGKIAKIAAWAGIIWGGIKVARRAFSDSKHGFWGNVAKLGAVAGGLYLFGPQLKTLISGGKLNLDQTIIGNMFKDRDGAFEKNPNALSAREQLSFVFGNLSVDQMLSMVEKDANGNFSLKKGMYKDLSTVMGLHPSQADMLNAYLGRGEGFINTMINSGLTSGGITPDNAADIKNLYGTMPLSEYLAGQAVISNYRQNIADALGTDMNDPRIADLETIYNPLDINEKKLFLERVNTLEGLTSQYSARKVILFDHLIGGKRGQIEKQLSAADVALMEQGFKNSGAIDQLRDSFIRGNSPFDKGQDINANTTTYHNEMKKVFGGSARYDEFISSATGDADINRLISDSAHPDTMVNVDFLSNKKWFVNRTDGSLAPELKYQEIMLDMGNNKKAMMGIEANSTGTHSLVIYVPTQDGSWAKYKLRTMAAQEANISGFGWRETTTTVGGVPNTVDEFVVRMRDPTAAAYKEQPLYGPNFLDTLVNSANSGTTSFKLAQSDYKSGTTPTPNEAVVLERVSGEDRK